jgi:hypothetical protein
MLSHKSHAWWLWRAAREAGLDAPTRFPRKHPLNAYQLADIFEDTNPLIEALSASPRIFERDRENPAKETILREAMATRSRLDNMAKTIIEKIKRGEKP